MFCFYLFAHLGNKDQLYLNEIFPWIFIIRISADRTPAASLETSGFGIFFHWLMPSSQYWDVSEDEQAAAVPLSFLHLSESCASW